MIPNTDLIGLQPIETTIDKQAPYQCSSIYYLNDEYDSFTTEPNADPNTGKSI